MNLPRFDDAEQQRGIDLRDYTRGAPPDSARSRLAGLSRYRADGLARILGFAGMGLGLFELIAPRTLQRLIGVRHGDHSTLIQAMGVREILAAMLIFMQPRPFTGALSRVIGDVLDLTLLSQAFSDRRNDKNRLTIATAKVLGLTALDVFSTVQLARERAEEQETTDLSDRELHGRQKDGSFKVTKNRTINRSPEELYAFWRNLENLPRFMYHLEKVEVIDERRSHWVAKAPAGLQVDWEAEITSDIPNQEIAWRSIEGSQVPNSGVVRFQPGQTGRGTVVSVEIEYRPPAGALGRAVAALFGEEPNQQVAADLKRFKQVMETGEVLRSEGSPEGYGQKMQYPARPAGEKGR